MAEEKIKSTLMVLNLMAQHNLGRHNDYCEVNVNGSTNNTFDIKGGGGKDKVEIKGLKGELSFEEKAGNKLIIKNKDGNKVIIRDFNNSITLKIDGDEYKG